MANSSLSSVVSSVVRGRPGSPIRGTVTDEDLDRHIGEIILREAKAKAELYKKEGIRAYLPKSDPNVPRANKRFLSSIIKNTDEYNKAIQRTYEQIQQEREEEERKECMRRAKEAASARRAKEKECSPGRRRRRGRDLSEDRWRPEDDLERVISKRERNRDWSKAYGDEGEDGTRSRSPIDRKRYWDEDEDVYEERRHKRTHEDDGKRHKRRRHDPTSRSPISVSPSRYSNARSAASRSPSPSPDRRNKGKGKDKAASHPSDPKRSSRHYRKRSESPSLKVPLNRIPLKEDTQLLEPSPAAESTPPFFSSKTSPPRVLVSNVHNQKQQRPHHSRPPSPSVKPPSLPPSPPPLPSKMDKYFDPSYDPRLDVTPLVTNKNLTIDVPSTGLIDDPRFDSWETMLELIKIRREDRAERKRLEKLGLLPDKKASGGSGKKGKGMISADVVGEDRGLMDIAYTKRGTVREWDMGKEI